jgi:tryptophan synthase alpha chain
MSRITDALSHARSEHRAALITYLCAGDPNLAVTPDLIVALAEAGADVIELGIPFSDPIADGPTIQRASERALRAGTTLPGVLDALAQARKHTDVPVLLFGYYNPFLTRGEERIAREAEDAGADGFLVVDLPPEECAPLRDPVVASGLDWIPLIAPTSTEERITRANAVATSFVYCISVAGVTGTSRIDSSEAALWASRIGARLGRPVALGFGIKTNEDVKRASEHVDGVVVGSAIVTAVQSSGVSGAARFVRELRAATAR